MKPNLAMKYGCPVCGKPVKTPSREQPKQAELFPFCSQRCKLLDLGAWLDGEYRISSDLQSGQSEESTPASSDNPSDTQ